ncbi:MAG: glycosyltransferase, partial [Tumebacillaceae bacterium]
FVGAQPQQALRDFYLAADALVLPSYYESFGMVALEAMACGTPTITSNSSSIPEVTGDAALLINPHDMYDLAEKMQTVLNAPDLRDAMRVNGIAQASKFSWEKCARETITAYEKLYAKTKSTT